MEQLVGKRKSFRMPFNAEVLCHVNEEEFQGTIRDLSVSGFFMETTQCPPTASKCVIEMVLIGDHSRLTIDKLSGCVSRCYEDGVGIEFDHRWEWVALVPIYFHKIQEQLTEMKKKIFIVDDDIIFHEAITAYLSSDEFEILHAYDGGHDLLERIENEQPDLIILDIMMPSGDGRDICRDVKKNPKTKNIKILMLSAKSEEHDRILGLEVGADEYITKPIDLLLLPNRIKRMCGMRMKTSINDK